MSGTYDDNHNVPPSTPPQSSPSPPTPPLTTSPAKPPPVTSTARPSLHPAVAAPAANINNNNNVAPTYQTKNRRIYFLVLSTLVILLLCAAALIVVVVKFTIALIEILWGMAVNMDTEGVVLRTIVIGAVVLLVTTKGRGWWGNKWSKGLQQLQHRIQKQKSKKRRGGFTEETGSPLSPASLLSEALFDATPRNPVTTTTESEGRDASSKGSSVKDEISSNGTSTTTRTTTTRLTLPSLINPTNLTVDTTTSPNNNNNKDAEAPPSSTTTQPPTSSTTTSIHSDLGRRCSTCCKYVIDCECIACRLCSKPFAVAVFYRHHCRKCWVACCSTCRSQRRCVNPFGGPVGLLRPTTTATTTTAASDVTTTPTATKALASDIATTTGDDTELFSPDVSMNTRIMLDGGGGECNAMDASIPPTYNRPLPMQSIITEEYKADEELVVPGKGHPAADDPFQPVGSAEGSTIEKVSPLPADKSIEGEVGLYFFKNRKQALEGAGEIEVMPLAGMKRAASYDHMETSIGSPNIMDHARRMFPSFPTSTISKAASSPSGSNTAVPVAQPTTSTTTPESTTNNKRTSFALPHAKAGDGGIGVAEKGEEMSPRLRGGKFIQKSLTNLDDADNTNNTDNNNTTTSSGSGLFATFPSMLSTLMSVARGSYYTSLLDGDTHHKLEAAVITNIPKKPVCDGCANYPALGRVFLHTYDHVSRSNRLLGLKLLEDVVEMPGRCASNVCNARTYQPTCPYCDLPTIDSQPFSSKAVVAQYGCRRCSMVTSSSSRCEKCKALDVALLEIERQCKTSQDANFRSLKVKDVAKVMGMGCTDTTTTPSVLSNSESLLNTKRVSFSSTFPSSSLSPQSSAIRTSWRDIVSPSTAAPPSSLFSEEGNVADLENNVNHMDGSYTKDLSLSERLILASIGASIAYEYPSHPYTSLEHFTGPQKRLVRIVESNHHYTILEGPFRTLIIAFPGTHDIRTALTNVKGLQRQRIVEYTSLNGGIVVSGEDDVEKKHKQQPASPSSSPSPPPPSPPHVNEESVPIDDDDGVEFHRIVRTASQKKYVSGPVSRADMVEEYTLSQRHHHDSTPATTKPQDASNHKDDATKNKSSVDEKGATNINNFNTTTTVVNGGVVELWKYKVHKGYHNEEKHLREPEYLPTSRLRGFLKYGGDTDAFTLRGGMKRKKGDGAEDEPDQKIGTTTATSLPDLVAGTTTQQRNKDEDDEEDAGSGGYRRIIFTGHSLGGAMSMLVTLRCLAEDLASFGGDRVSCLTFGAPFVGDSQLSRRVSMCGWNPYFHNIIFKMDVVPRLASFFGKKHLPAASIMFRNLIEDALGFNVSSAAQLLPSMLSRTVSNLSNNTSNGGGGSLGRSRSDDGRVAMGDRPSRVTTSPTASRQRSRSRSKSTPQQHDDGEGGVIDDGGAEEEEGAPTMEFPNGVHSVVTPSSSSGDNNKGAMGTINNASLVESEEGTDEDEEEEEDYASEMSQDDNDVDDIAIQSWAQIVATVASKSPSSLVTRAKSGSLLGGSGTTVKKSVFPTSISTGSLSMVAKEFLDGAASKMASIRGVPSTAVHAMNSMGNDDNDDDDDGDMGSSTTTAFSSAAATTTHTIGDDGDDDVGVGCILSPTSSSGAAAAVGDLNISVNSKNTDSENIITPSTLLQLQGEEGNVQKQHCHQTPRRPKKIEGIAVDDDDIVKVAGESLGSAVRRGKSGGGGGHIRRSVSAGHNRFSTTNETAIRNQLAFPPKGARRAYNPIGTYHFLNFRQGNYYQRYQATDCPENVVKLLRWGRPSKWWYHAHGSSTLGPPRMSFDDGHHIEATTDARFTVRDHLMHNYARAVWELTHFD